VVGADSSRLPISLLQFSIDLLAAASFLTLSSFTSLSLTSLSTLAALNIALICGGAQSSKLFLELSCLVPRSIPSTSTSPLTLSSCPSCTATISGVNPAPSLAFTSIPGMARRLLNIPILDSILSIRKSIAESP